MSLSILIIDDEPHLPHQFARYLKSLLALDFGNALTTGQPVIHDIARVFPATLELASVAILIGTGLDRIRASTLRIGTMGITASPHYVLPTLSALGGGVDFRLAKTIGWRVPSDFLQTPFFGSAQNNFRVSTGVVVRF